MNVITLRDYAKQNNVSYEAVRKQVVRYASELEGHLIRDGRQQFLDEEAVAFLNSKRQKNPVAIIQIEKDEKIALLEQENKNLLIKVAAQADELREAEKALAKVDILLLNEKNNQEKIETLEAQNRDLSADRDKEREEHLKAEKTAQELSDELTAIKGKWYYKLFAGKK